MVYGAVSGGMVYGAVSGVGFKGVFTRFCFVCFLFVFDRTKMQPAPLRVQTQILRLLPKYLAGNSAFFLIFALLLSVLIHTETI